LARRPRSSPRPCASTSTRTAGAIRLNKHIAETGICSRREADAWIEAGRIQVNGHVATLGTQVEPGDEVRLDGELIAQKKPAIYLLLNKPVGVTSTTDRKDPDNIVDLVGHAERIFPIGRLDKDSTGLILLTNDGDIVNRILRAENRHEKEYLVEVDRPTTDLFLKLMADGVRIGGIVTRPCKISREAPARFRIVLTQGLNRQIRRMCSALGFKVRRLQRVRIMHLTLGKLRPGEWRELTPAERERLFTELDSGESR
jgi:23S rRNA pseudouridine2604 synthase